MIGDKSEDEKHDDLIVVIQSSLFYSLQTKNCSNWATSL